MTEILVVPSHVESSEPLVNLLRSQGFAVTVANGFQEATEVLNHQEPLFLLADLRLGSFNGLHLTIRHREDHPRMHTILLDCAHDADIEREAARQGALYLIEPVDASDLLRQISAGLASDGPPRRWRRKSPAHSLLVRAGTESARVVDMSYGGVRLEVAGETTFSPVFEIVSDELNCTVRAETVWTRKPSRGWIECGAQIIDEDPQHRTSWRQLVDSVEGSRDYDSG